MEFTTLKYYQIEAVKFLNTRKRAILNMGCGTGKTITALFAAQYLKTLVVAPPNLREKWESEREKLIEMGHSKKAIRFDFASPYKKVYGKNYDCVIVDEAHAFVDHNKNRQLIDCLKKASFNYFLTATPLIHTPLDAYWMLKLCGGVGFSRHDFTLYFCDGKVIYNKKGKPQAVSQGISHAKEFKERMDNCSYSYFRTEKILKKAYNLGKSPIKSSKKIRSFATEQAILGEFKSKDVKTLNLLRNYLKKYRKVVVFFFHTDGAKFLYAKTKKNAFYIDGAVPFSKRYEIISEFEKTKKPSILYLNYRSSGVGLDIEGINACIFIEQTWSPSTDYQAYMRLYRFSRKKPLVVARLTYEGEHRKITSLGKEKLLLKSYK